MSGFSTTERAAMRARAEELRDQGRSGRKAADDLESVLDDGPMWPTAFAIEHWTDEVEAAIEGLVRRATTPDDDHG